MTISGAMNAVRLLYVGDDGVPRVRSINLRNVIDGLNLEQDMIVPNNAIIYVPTSALAETGRFLDWSCATFCDLAGSALAAHSC